MWSGISAYSGNFAFLPSSYRATSSSARRIGIRPLASGFAAAQSGTVLIDIQDESLPRRHRGGPGRSAHWIAQLRLWLPLLHHKIRNSAPVMVSGVLKPTLHTVAGLPTARHGRARACIEARQCGSSSVVTIVARDDPLEPSHSICEPRKG
jgi:hypothetical protein